MTARNASAVCVTGMHRSGTSAAAGVLRELGVDFGAEGQLMGPGPDNKSGYWENRFIKELDDELLAELGGSWDQPPVLEPGWEREASLDGFRRQAGALLDDAFGPVERRTVYGWKDPRLSVLLPFWRTVSPVARTVLVVRDPLEVAASLERRNGIGGAQACLLWLRYVLSASRQDPHHVLVTLPDLLGDLPRAMADLAAALELDPPSQAAVEQADARLDRSLQHHHSIPPPTTPDPLTVLALLVWNEGDVDLAALPQPVADAIATGWLRPPADTEALDAARAKVTELTERLRKRSRARKAAAAASTTDVD